MVYRIERLWFEPRADAFLVSGRLGPDRVRFAVTRSALDAYGWNSCLEEALRRVGRGERDFGIAPSTPRHPVRFPARAALGAAALSEARVE